ncbi:hypothetical protein LUD21_27975, partial [Klebsiella pneumoniae]|nr:hypothetical protein [Klebsiella pneumoniae]
RPDYRVQRVMRQAVALRRLIKVHAAPVTDNGDIQTPLFTAPPIIGFASSGWKDSVRNIVETKEFVWNLATRPLAMAMNETSA